MSIRTRGISSQIFPSKGGGSSGRVRTALTLVIASVLCGALLTSCASESGDDSGSSASGSAEKAKVEAQAARKKAEEANAKEVFPEKFAKAVERLDDGDDLLDSGENSKAKQKYRYAKRGFDDVAKKAVIVIDKYDAAVKFKEEVDRVLQQAVAAGAQTTAATDFADTQTRYQAVWEGIESLESAKIDGAKRNLTRIRDDFQELVTTARQNAVLKDKAINEREAMAKMKAAAKDNPGVKVHAAQDLVYAEQSEREADSDFEAGNYQRALSGYQLAGQNFTAAIERAENMKKLLASTSNPNPNTPQPIPVGRDIRPAPTEPIPGTEDPFAGLELTAEDLAVAENIKLLLPSFGTKSVYDAATQRVTLDYSSANLLRNDLSKNLKNNSKYLSFKDPMLMGSQGPGGSGGGDFQSFAFSGNTQGLFLIPVPLKGDIVFEYTVNLMTMDQQGSMGPVLLSDEMGRSAWQADFAILRRMVKGKRPASKPSMKREYRKSANYWFDKVAQVPMRVEARPDESKEGYHRIYIYYNGEAEPTNVGAAYKSETVGYIGWSWRRVKFVIRDLRITGTLDVSEAAKILRKKGLKIEEPSEDSGPSGEDSDDPTAPKGDGSKTGGKKGGGDFDF